jgi:hypothetical protein
MMLKLTPDLYWVACTLAGDWRRGYLPHGVNLLSAEPRLPHLRKAVYVVTDRAGRVAYVGKVCRPEDIAAVESRLREHVEQLEKAMTWAMLYVVPLKSETPDVVVEYIEGLIGERLKPYQNKRLPNVVRLASIVEEPLADSA